MLVSRVRLFFALLLQSNAVHAATDGEFPPHLSIQDYRKIISFADDDDNKLINEFGVGTDNKPLFYWDHLLSGTSDDVGSGAVSSTGSNTSADKLFPFIICHSDNSDMCGTDRYNAIDSVLSKVLEDNDIFYGPRYSIKRTPIYNKNFKRRTQDENKKDTLYGTCFFASLGVSLARNITKKEILVTPVAPLLKMRKNISTSLEGYDEDSIDEDTISISAMLAPGILSSHDGVVELARRMQNFHGLSESDAYFTDCDKKVFERSTVTVGSSDNSFYFFFEFLKQDLKAGIKHKCHRLFASYIAEQQQVISVEKVMKNTVSNFHAKWIVESGVKEKNPWAETGLNGNGEIIFVADTGLDVHHCYLRDFNEDTVPLTTDFDLTGKINHDLRKVVQYVALDDIDSDSQDRNGHGTHVVGTIVGKRLNGNGQEKQGVGEGIASAAKVAFYDGNSGDSKDISVNSIISQFFYFGKIAGAKINSSSWNSGSFGEYDEKTRQVDAYFYDDPDDEMLMIAAGGNDGLESTITDIGTVKYPCVSKNALCIGASRNYISDMDDIDVVAKFSSYGPTADGRIKPDLIAPGEHVLSLDAKNSDKCGASQYSSADGLTFKSGTSMACPVVAGAGALVKWLLPVKCWR